MFCVSDINECERYNGTLCDHACTDTDGSYTCGCQDGYRLSPDLRNCTSKAKILKQYSQCLLFGVSFEMKIIFVELKSWSIDFHIIYSISKNTRYRMYSRYFLLMLDVITYISKLQLYGCYVPFITYV